jgi:hypothetical protein
MKIRPITAMLFITALTSAAPISHAAAPKPDPAAAHYERIRAATTLDAPGKSPFHIKIEFQLFDFAGKPTSTGTVDEWWAPEVGARIVITSPTFSEAEPLPEGASMPAASRDGALIHELLKQFAHPLFDQSETKDLKYSEESRKFGQTSLTCIALKYRFQDAADERYCFDPGTDDLRFELPSRSFKVVRNNPGKFRDSSVALDLSLSYGANDCIRGHVTALQAIDASAVSPGAEAGIASPARLGKRIGGKDLEGIVTRQSYSCVSFESVVGKDGKVSSVAVVYSNDQSLTDAVKAAVPTWKYAPVLQNGKPVEVRSTGAIEVEKNSY